MTMMIGRPRRLRRPMRAFALLACAFVLLQTENAVAQSAQSAWTSSSLANAAAAIKAHQSKSQSDAKSQKQGGDKGGFEIQTSGVGTQNRLAKWTETGGLGNLGDSVVAESPSTGFLGIGTGMTAPVSALELAGSGANGSGGITLGTGAVAKSVYQVIKVGSEILSFFGGNLFVDGSLVSQRFNTSQVGWAAALDARASQDLFKLERLSAAGVTTRPAIIRGDGSFGFGNITSPPNLTGAKFMMDSAGNVGIGTTSPGAALDVLNSVAAGTPTARFKNINAANTQVVIDSAASQDTNLRFDDNTSPVWYVGNLASNDRFRLLNSNANSNTEVFTVLQGGNVGIGTTNPQAKLDIAGNAKVTGDLTVTGVLNAKYQDVAEWVPASHAIAAGTVVVLDPDQSNHVLASMKAYDTRVAGVVSAKPGVILGEGGNGKVMVATTGRVRIKVDATNGPIRVGDLLVTSDKEGIAMRSQPLDLGGTPIHRPGTLIGKALEPLEKGVGEILVLLSLQ